jgi:hypothetical protein
MTVKYFTGADTHCQSRVPLTVRAVRTIASDFKTGPFEEGIKISSGLCGRYFFGYSRHVAFVYGAVFFPVSALRKQSIVCVGSGYPSRSHFFLLPEFSGSRQNEINFLAKNRFGIVAC